MLDLLFAMLCQSTPSPLSQSSLPSEVRQSAKIKWADQYVSGYSPAFDMPYAVALDPSGNAYVTGLSSVPGALYDIATIKYSSAGDTLWIQRYDGPGHSWDQGLALAVDASGNVYVTGTTYSDATFFDFVTIKYDASGNEEWVAYYDGPGSGDDSAIDTAVDGAGNVYVTGYSGGSGTFYDYATIKYDNSGHEQWVARYNGPGNTKDIASALALDPSGNVYVTGSSGEGSPNLSDYVTVKYDTFGIERWVARYSDLYDYATAIAVDALGNAYVTGYSYHAGTFYDYATVKYNTMGVQKWVARYNGPGGSDDTAHDVKVDASGSVFVTGESVGPGTSTDYATIKYSASGAQQWIRRYDGPGKTVDVAVALALDASGNVYVTGGSRDSDLIDDFATVMYDASGDEQWVIRYDAPGRETYDLATAIGVDASSAVYVTGGSTKTGGRLYTTIKIQN